MRRRTALTLPVALFAGLPASPRAATLPVSRFFTTSDGVRLHYLEAGRGHTIVFVPGWDMPGWIWQRQLEAFAPDFRVVAFDPRSQGDSDIARSGNEPIRRSQDIAELIDQLDGTPVLLVGWSLGVLDTLAYVHTHGDAHLAGLVLVDNSVGEEPAPVAHASKVHLTRPAMTRSGSMAAFVRSMFVTPQPPDYLERLTEAALRTPPDVSAKLLSYPVPRTYWREAIYSTDRPVLYVVRPGFAGQAANLAAKRANTQTMVMTGAGHALFVDRSFEFNSLMYSFIRQRVWR
jgi:microsomal epoxide hydrolase